MEPKREPKLMKTNPDIDYEILDEKSEFKEGMRQLTPSKRPQGQGVEGGKARTILYL